MDEDVVFCFCDGLAGAEEFPVALRDVLYAVWTV